MEKRGAQEIMPISKAGTSMSEKVMALTNLKNTDALVKSSGFTLIEAMVALVIVSISLLALLKLQVVNIGLVETSEILSQAVLLAEEKMSETVASGYPDVGVATGIVENNAAVLQWRTQVSDVSSAELGSVYIDGLRKISVEVTWKAGLGSKHLRILTYAADRNL